jgi:hypothetical protein
LLQKIRNYFSGYDQGYEDGINAFTEHLTILRYMYMKQMEEKDYQIDRLRAWSVEAELYGRLSDKQKRARAAKMQAAVDKEPL